MTGKWFYFLMIMALSCSEAWAQTEKAQKEVSVWSLGLELHGTLQGAQYDHVVLFIAGSGPSDRNGNQPGYQSNCLKMIADSLETYGIASLRYDKRGIGKSVDSMLSDENVRFDHLVEDAEAWIELLDKRFKKISIMGHSQGTLVGLLAASDKRINKFITLAGLANSMYLTLQRQLGTQPKFVTDAALPILDSLAQGIKVDSVPPYLNNLFNPALQDYLISSLHYDSRKEIAKLNIPVLVVQGTTDIQIPVEEAEELAASALNGQLAIVEGMNHILKPAPEAPITNLNTYNQPELLLHVELVPILVKFLK
jgi:pimeloyl-ACP methyl ester carboxylesterase